MIPPLLAGVISTVADDFVAISMMARIALLPERAMTLTVTAVVLASGRHNGG